MSDPSRAASEPPSHRALLAALERGAEGRLLETRGREEQLRAELAEWEARADGALGERDALIGALRRLEEQRADAVRMVLELLAAEPGRRRRAEREARRALQQELLETLLAMNLRPYGPELPFDAGDPARGPAPREVEAMLQAVASVSLDVVVLARTPADLPPEHLRLLEERTPYLAAAHLVGDDAPRLRALAGDREGWDVAADVAGALQRGSAPFVALLDAGARMPWGWRDALMAAARRERIGAVMPLSAGPDPDSQIVLPHGVERLGPEAVSLLLSRRFGGIAWHVPALHGPCVLLRREALAVPAGETFVELGARLVQAGWGLATTPAAFVGVTAEPERAEPAAPAKAPRRQTSIRAADEGATRHRAEALDAISIANATPRAFGGLLRQAGPLARVVYVLSARDDQEAVDAASTDVLGLHDLGLPADIVAVWASDEDLPALGRRVERDHLPAALRGAALVVAASPRGAAKTVRAAGAAGALAAVMVRAGGERVPRGALVLTPSPALRAGLPEPAAVVTPAVDDEVFHPGIDETGTARMSVLVRLPAGDDGGARLAALRERVADDVEVRTFEAGALPRADRAAALGRCDVLVDLVADDAVGQTVLEAMACGAVPVVAASSGAAQLVADGREGVLVTADADGSWTDAVGALTEDWERFRTLRRAALHTAGRHGRMAGATSRYAALLEHLRSAPASARRGARA